VVKSTADPGSVFTDLLAHDILIRDVSKYPMLGDYFRLSIGTVEENDRLLESIREISG
jgi:histidinol-phosphate aminotransferase